MRNVSLSIGTWLLCSLIFLAACNKSDPKANTASPNTPDTTIVKKAIDTSTSRSAQTDTTSKGPVPKDSAFFKSGPYGNVTGKVLLYTLPSGEQRISFDSFASTQGPDLKVYLSKEQFPLRFINLGSLKANAGPQSYNFPATVKLSDYPYVLVHCEQYNHLFGFALLGR